MECLFQDSAPTFGDQTTPDSTYFAPRRDIVDYQQTYPARFHPYGRLQHPQPYHQPTYRNMDIYSQYQHHFESIHQPLPGTYSDVTMNQNTAPTNNWYPNSIGYAYPNLNFLQDTALKPGPETGFIVGNISPTQTYHLTSQAYAGFGDNYEQNPSFDPRRKMAPASIGHTRTRDKYRVVYTDSQKISLEEEYEKTPFITEKRREELAEEINLSERQIKFWFQNRRVKDRRGKNAKQHKQSKETTQTVAEKNQNINEVKNHSNTTAANQYTIDVSKKAQTADQTPSNRPPCRFTEQYSRRTVDVKLETNAYNGDAMFSAEGTTSRPFYGAGFLPESGVRYPVSPSDWTTLSEASLLTTLNVSPILTTVENDLTTRS